MSLTMRACFAALWAIAAATVQAGCDATTPVSGTSASTGVAGSVSTAASSLSTAGSAKSLPRPRLPPSSPTSYQIYALRYGTLPTFPKRDVLRGAPASESVELALIFWLVRGEGRTLLIDSGFAAPELVGAKNVRGYESPVEVLAKVGVVAEMVTDVILTHAHWDHAGGTRLFPKATIHIQRAEYDWAMAVCGARAERGGVRRDDLRAIAEADKNDRVQWLHGETTVAPGVVIHRGGAHTGGISFVTVATADERVVVASDNAYLYANIEQKIPIGASRSATAERSNLARMRSLASSAELILPGHDPAVFQRFPNPGGGVARLR